MKPKKVALLLASALAVAAVVVVFDLETMKSDSMAPVIEPGATLLVARKLWDKREGDLVTVVLPEVEVETVRRLVGSAADIEEKKVMQGGRPSAILVAERSGGWDSRELGPIEYSRITGRVLLVFNP